MRQGSARVPVPSMATGGGAPAPARNSACQCASQPRMAAGEPVSAANQSSNTAVPRAGNCSQARRGVPVMPSRGRSASTTWAALAAPASPAARSCAVNSATAVSIQMEKGKASRSASERSRGVVSPGSCRPSSTRATSGRASSAALGLPSALPGMAMLPRTPRKRISAVPKPSASTTSAASRMGAVDEATTMRVPGPVPSVESSGIWAHRRTVRPVPSSVTLQRQPTPTVSLPSALLSTT